MCSAFAWFSLLTLPAWNSIQAVSCVQLFCLTSIADIACMKSHPGCESCAAPLLNFYCWHWLNEIPSRLWVVCSAFSWFPLLTLSAWNFIQAVSCVQLLCLISIADIACMKFHPGCESCAAPLLHFYCWHCLHEIPSRLWVMCSAFAWFPLLTLFVWNPIQTVSHVQHLCLISIADIACMKFIQAVSCVQHLCLISITDIACIKSHQGCEWCAAPLLDFHCWHCLHEILSREWVVCSSFAWFPLLTLPAWNLIQIVSPVQLLCLISIADIACMKFNPGCEFCAAPLLDFHCWHCLYAIPSSMWAVCSSSLWFLLLILQHEIPSSMWV